MCHADTSWLMTFDWEESQSKPLINTSREWRTCVDWDALVGSFSDRVLSEEELDMLEKPQ